MQPRNWVPAFAGTTTQNVALNENWNQFNTRQPNIGFRFGPTTCRRGPLLPGRARASDCAVAALAAMFDVTRVKPGRSLRKKNKSWMSWPPTNAKAPSKVAWPDCEESANTN